MTGDVSRFDQLAFGQLQDQADAARHEGRKKLPAVLDQFQVVAMARGNVDADMKRRGKARRLWPQQRRGLLHQRAGHRHNESGVFGERDKQIRAHQAFLGMIPAHQHFSARPLFTVAMHHGLEVRNELACL